MTNRHSIRLCAPESVTVAEQLPAERAQNLEAFRTPEAVSEFSEYRLHPGEEYLFNKYYKSGERVLDLACGMGRTTVFLHEMGLSVRGVDQSEVFIHTAKRRLPYLDLRVGSYDRIEEPDSSFCHVLISFNGIDYAYPETQRMTALAECARVLKPGGTFIYSSHNLKSLHVFSPYYFRGRLLWKTRFGITAFKRSAYVLERGLHTLYASADFVARQTESLGLKLVETVGFRKFWIERVDKYFSPYIHYVFVKPVEELLDSVQEREREAGSMLRGLASPQHEKR